MATTTRVALLQTLSEAIGDWKTYAATSNGAAGGTTIVSTQLNRLTNSDDYWNDWYARVTSGTASGEIRQASDFATSTGTLTVPAFSAQIASAVTFEMHVLNPQLKLDAIKAASQQCFPKLYLPLSNETVIVDNLLSNGGMETAVSGGSISGWTNNGTPTLASETSIVLHGTNSLSIVASGAAEGVYQALSTNIEEVTGKTAHVRVWVYATAASTARIRLSFDGGSTFTSHDYHSGNDQWELQKLDTAIPSTATSVRLYLEVADGGTAYFDLASGWILPVYRHTIPTTFVRFPHRVWVQAAEDRPNGVYLPLALGQHPPSGRLLRLDGMGMLSQPSTDAGTVEIGNQHEEYFIAVALRSLYRMVMSQGSQQERDYMEKLKRDWEGDIDRLERRPGMTMRGIGAEVPPRTYRFAETSSGMYLDFKV